MGVEFGEKVLYKVKLKNKTEKINARWDYGIFVGIRRQSNELLVATKEGVVKVRSVKRIPIEERWGEDCVKWVKHCPWNRYCGDEYADGEIPEGVPEERVVDAPEVVPGSGGVVFTNTRERAPQGVLYSGSGFEGPRVYEGMSGVCSSGEEGSPPATHPRMSDELRRDLEGYSQSKECQRKEEGL